MYLILNAKDDTPHACCSAICWAELFLQPVRGLRPSRATFQPRTPALVNFRVELLTIMDNNETTNERL